MLLKFGISLLLSCAVIVHGQGYINYKDYQIFDIIATRKEHLEILNKYNENSKVEFFRFERQLNKVTKVLVPPDFTDIFDKMLQEHEFDFTVVVDDVSVVLEKERQETMPRSGQSRLEVFENFYRHDEINAYLDSLASQYPTRAYVKKFGRTYEGRFMKTITITNGDGRTNKNVILIDAGMHAREWITPAMALYVITELIDNFAENADLLLDYDWVILPVVNADGYEYTHEVDRFWRKTVKPTNSESGCNGTDPNRNFDYGWGLDEGSSPEPCDETYRGGKSFSEPETQVVRDLMLHYNNRTKFYLSLHSYGNYMLLPWGHKTDLPDTFDDMMHVAEQGAFAIVLATGTSYTYGSTVHVLYATSGDSIDYAHGSVNIPIAIVMELPRGGVTGFNPPVSAIEETVTETWIGIRAMAKAVIERF